MFSSLIWYLIEWMLSREDTSENILTDDPDERDSIVYVF